MSGSPAVPGGAGIDGGLGGAGGGALEVRVLGSVEFGSACQLLAQGGDGAAPPTATNSNSGTNGAIGGSGASGANGKDGYDGGGPWPGAGGPGGSNYGLGGDGTAGVPVFGDGGTGGGGGGGGDGGDGKGGGTGGRGADGGLGGWGAGGAGGTVKVVASVLQTQTGAQVGVAGGQGGGTGVAAGAPGGDGRFALGRSTTQGIGGLSVAGELVEMSDTGGRNLGTRSLNPYLVGWITETPYIPGLVDGADAFGLTDLSATDPGLAWVLEEAPIGGKAALVRMDTGAGTLAQDWDGFDMLLLVNLTDKPLEAPEMGVGREGYLIPLMQGGFERSALFGGAGYEVVDALPAYGVYAMLVPEGSTSFNMMAEGCEFSTLLSLDPGGAMYLLPEPATLVLLALGGLGVLVRCKPR